MPYKIDTGSSRYTGGDSAVTPKDKAILMLYNPHHLKWMAGIMRNIYNLGGDTICLHCALHASSAPMTNITGLRGSGIVLK